MFKIERIVKQISNASQIIKKATTSISSLFQNLTQDQGCIKDVSDEFTFAKALPVITTKQPTKDTLSPLHFKTQDMAKLQSIERPEIRKLIYQRFADEIGRKPTKGVGIIKGTSEEFDSLREQGYNFKELRSLIEKSKSFQDLEEQSSSDNKGEGSRSLSERMKDLVISGYLSNYSGEVGLRQDIEEVMHKKVLVTQEFMDHLSVKDFSISNASEVQNELSVIG